MSVDLHRSAVRGLATIALCAGTCAGQVVERAAERARSADNARGAYAGSVRYSVATGEWSVGPPGPLARDASTGVWLANNFDPCLTGLTVAVVDDPDADGDSFGDFLGRPEEPGAGELPQEGAWAVSWGDIGADTPVDCIVLAYGTRVPDIDSDSDGIGDGVLGSDLLVTFIDAEVGFGGVSARQCLMEMTIPTLPGQLPGAGPEEFAVYFLTIDFTSAAPSLAFELGDSDGIDSSGAGNFNPNSYFDFDSDGLHDFGYAFRFSQPANQADRGATGLLQVAPIFGNPGDPEPDPADAQGLEDLSDYYLEPDCLNTFGSYIGTFFFGGFTCDPGSEIPFSQDFLELYTTVCESGTEADVSAVTGYQQLAPLAEPFDAPDREGPPDTVHHEISIPEGCPSVDPATGMQRPNNGDGDGDGADDDRQLDINGAGDGRAQQAPNGSLELWCIDPSIVPVGGYYALQWDPAGPAGPRVIGKCPFEGGWNLGWKFINPRTGHVEAIEWESMDHGNRDDDAADEDPDVEDEWEYEYNTGADTVEQRHYEDGVLQGDGAGAAAPPTRPFDFGDLLPVNPSNDDPSAESVGGSPCNAADLAGPFGELNFSDVVAFLSAFSLCDPDADLADPFGVCNFSDVLAFLTLFSAGCPADIPMDGMRPKVDINTDVDVSISTVVANEGPLCLAGALIAITVTAPDDCTVNGMATSTINYVLSGPDALAIGGLSKIEDQFTINCSEQGIHVFTIETALLPTDPNLPIPLTDPELSDNFSLGTLTVEAVIRP